jgi:2-oxopent-4-enoate/cis-2-oxohex-4-enoate hydratase
MSGAVDNDTRIRRSALALDRALRERAPVAPLTQMWTDLSVEQAYQISREFLELRLARGDAVVGKKIGATSRAVQEMLQVYQPDFGFLLASMQVPDGGIVRLDQLIQPRAEAEVAFMLAADLVGPGVTESDVLDATAAVAPCFEIVDSRIQDWRIRIGDTVADNASCGSFVIGAGYEPPRRHDLPSVEARVFKNGLLISRGLGSAVQGSPVTAVAWLANTLGRLGVPLKAGEWILSGSLVPLEPAVAGDVFELQLDPIGTARVHFE